MEIGSGTRAIVTGASKGIGRATARALAARGAKLGLIARGKDELEAAAAEVGEGTHIATADVADRGAIDKAVAGLVEELGGVEIMVANAGIAKYAPFADQDPDEAERMVLTNVLGTMNTVRAALEPMLDRAKGHIVVVSSGAGLRAFPWGAVYGATKAADKGFAEALRHELSGTGVSVSTVYPGEVKTAIHEDAEQLPDWRDNDGAIDAVHVAEAVLEAVEGDRRDVYVPKNVRLLGLNDLAPGLVDRLLASIRGGSAAPRRY